MTWKDCSDKKDSSNEKHGSNKKDSNDENLTIANPTISHLSAFA
jgi:hypothetical protein